jgi:hypothetical protein
MRNAECGLRNSSPLQSSFSFRSQDSSNFGSSHTKSAFRVPRSAFESPTRFHNSRYLALKREVAKRDARYAELPKVSARSTGLRAAVADADRAAVTRHFLQQDNRRIDLFRRRSRIVDDLLRRRTSFTPQCNTHFAFFVLYYFADLCHKSKVSSFEFRVSSRFRNSKPETQNA